MSFPIMFYYSVLFQEFIYSSFASIPLTDLQPPMVILYQQFFIIVIIMELCEIQWKYFPEVYML